MAFLNPMTNDSEHGRMTNLSIAGSCVFGIVVMFANFKIYMVSFIHYWFSLTAQVVSVLLYFTTVLLLNELLPIKSWLNNFDSRGTFFIMFTVPNFYLAALLVLVVCFGLKPVYREIRKVIVLWRKVRNAPTYTIVVEEPQSDEELMPINEQSHRPFSIAPAFTPKSRKT
jgi:hypothetical protein